MTAIAKAKFPKAKISRAVGAVLPKGQPFTLRIADSEIGERKIVRVVTPAWKTLRGWERIHKILSVVNNALTPQEQKRILRFSVLTPDEYEAIVEGPARKPRRIDSRRAAKANAGTRKAA